MKEIYSSPLWQRDLDTALTAVPEIEELAGRSVLITGATGLILSAVADLLIRYNETHEKKITIIVAARSAQRVSARFGEYAQRDYFRFLPYDAAAPQQEPPLPADYMIHGASNASPDLFLREPVETMLSNFQGMKHWLDWARTNGSRRVLFVSSSEVYGSKTGSGPFREGEYGYVDLLKPRSSYAVSKRAAETLCAAYAAEYGVDAVIVRPGHIYGPTATPKDGRVSSAWAYAAARGEELVMKSEGKQLRSYCYCLDSASAILKVLLCGQSVCAYNISNPNSVITIKEMAQLLAEAGGVRFTQELPSEAEKRAFNPMDNSSLDSSSLQALGWEGKFDAKTGFAHTVQILRERNG